MKKIILSALLLPLLFACTPKLPSSFSTADSSPAIFPDYKDIMIPCNIAPMNFLIEEEADECITVFKSGSTQVTVKGSSVRIPKSKWQKLTGAPEINVQVFCRSNSQWTAYQPFTMTVSDEIDPYISYRIIPVAVESYEKLSLHQRSLTDFKEKTYFANTMVQNNDQQTCINCHYYKNWDTDNMMFHVRHFKGGTILVLDGKLHKVNMKTEKTISAGVYPSWHPTHDYIALSNNWTHQSVHAASHDKLEVIDENNDIILYNTLDNTVSVIENDSNELECFPGWSADGRTLYYVSAHYEGEFGPNRESQMFLDRKMLHFDLYSKSFNPENREWGKRQLIYDAAAVDSSMTWPRVSPDGRWMVCCISTHGIFPLDQIASDYVIFDLNDYSYRYADELNSPFAESYHTWSSNGKWLMFSTRREDGVHTRLYFSHIDENGHFSKPFALPQRDPDFNREFLYAFNIPEFMKEPIHITPRQFASFISSTDATPSKYVEKVGE
ncbi:MAG: PD40 domain-containing protein [Bacteroidaceae bacterium]|nr:PD40 domain-containing protein [Bacteroidaceae bacterium]